MPKPETTPPPAGNVLVVEDDMDCGVMLVQVLSIAGYGVRWVQSRDEAVKALNNNLYDHIILDVSMTGMGIDIFIREYVARANRHNVVLISAVTDPEKEAERLGVKHALRKPFDPETLVGLLRGLSQPQSQYR
jgi:DNA-binding response OmpR family regulator